jgi:hypothetical protein
MRLHIVLDDDLVADLDRRVGRRQRSSFLAELIRRGLEDERRWDDIESALSGIPDTGHEWDEDPSSWVRAQRRGDARRAG